MAKKLCQDCQNFIKEGSKILDLGCGSAIIANEFQNYFKVKIVGLDIKDYRIFPIPFRIYDGKNIPFEDNSFDIVLISYVLHHCQNPEIILKEAKRIGQKIIIFEDLPEGILAKARNKIHELIYNFCFAKNSPPLNFKTKKEWEEIFEKLELKLIAEKRISTIFDFYDPAKRVLFVLKNYEKT